MGILLVYDVTSKKTFDNITNWLKNIEEHAAEGVEQLLVANKVEKSTHKYALLVLDVDK